MPLPLKFAFGRCRVRIGKAESTSRCAARYWKARWKLPCCTPACRTIPPLASWNMPVTCSTHMQTHLRDGEKRCRTAGCQSAIHRRPPLCATRARTRSALRGLNSNLTLTRQGQTMPPRPNLDPRPKKQSTASVQRATVKLELEKEKPHLPPPQHGPVDVFACSHGPSSSSRKGRKSHSSRACYSVDPTLCVSLGRSVLRELPIANYSSCIGRGQEKVWIYR